MGHFNPFWVGLIQTSLQVQEEGITDSNPTVCCLQGTDSEESLFSTGNAVQTESVETQAEVLNSQLDVLARLNELSGLSWELWSNLTWQRPDPRRHHWRVSRGQVKDHKAMILEHKTKIAENVLEPSDCNSKVTPAGSLTGSWWGSDPGSNEPIKTSWESKCLLCGYRCELSGPRWSSSEVWMQVTRPVKEQSSI